MEAGSALASGTVACLALGLLAAAALHDLAWRLIPNRLPAALLACGLVLRLGEGELLPAVLAAVIVFGLSVLAWLAGGFGGGDAKLLGSTTMVVPPSQVPDLLLLTALAGGALALLCLTLRPVVPRPAPRRPAGLFRRILRTEAWRLRRGGPLPYAVAIASGAAATLLGA